MDKKIKLAKVSELKGEDFHRTFSIRLREDIASELDKIANETRRSRNQLINIFLEHSVNNWELDEK